MTELQDTIEALRSRLADQVTSASRVLADMQALLTTQADATAGALTLALRAAELAGQVTPPQPPSPPTTTGRVRSLWRFGWRNIDPASWPPDVAASLTHVTLAMAQSAGPGTGKLTPPPATRALVTGLTARGIDVFAGIGGSGDGGIRITNPGQVTDALISIISMQAALGITGITLDLEGPPGSGWTVDSMTALGKACLAGGLKVGIWSSLYGGRLEGWGSVARALGQGLHHWQRGFYDFPQAASSMLTGIVLGDVAAMRAYVQRDDQIVCSFAQQGSSSSSPVPVIAAAYAAARAKYPGVGFSVWEDSVEASRGWTATRALAQL